MVFGAQTDVLLAEMDTEGSGFTVMVPVAVAWHSPFSTVTVYVYVPLLVDVP